MHGGKRKGAGAPIKSPEFKKKPVNLKITGWLNDWLEDQDESKISLIEQAVIEKHNLKFAKVFSSKDEAIKSGLPIDYDDSCAMSGKQSFALLDNFKYSKKSKGVSEWLSIQNLKDIS